MKKKNKADSFSTVFDGILKAYLLSSSNHQSSIQTKSDEVSDPQDKRFKNDSIFFGTCKCGKNCQLQFTVDELLKAREDFRSLSLDPKNCVMRSQLNCWKLCKPMALSV